MNNENLPEGCRRLSPHVVQIPLPTSTLPPENFTNTYIVHQGKSFVVIDAGCPSPECLATIRQVLHMLGCMNPMGLIATHYHHDHTAGLPALAQALAAPIYVQQLDLPAALQTMRTSSVTDAQNWVVSAAPSEIKVGSIVVELAHLPGHTHGHMHVRIPEDGVVLVGDHLSGFGTVWIGPPDGHMNLYYQALDVLMEEAYALAGPGHGDALVNVGEVALALKNRRLSRERQMTELIRTNPHTVQELVERIYGNDLAPEVRWAAEKTVLAHLLHLREQDILQREYDLARKVFLYRLRGF